MSDKQASLQSVSVDHQRADAVLSLDIFSNTRETVLGRFLEAPGTSIPPRRAQPSRRRRGTSDTHLLPFIHLMILILGTLYIRAWQDY